MLKWTPYWVTAFPEGPHIDGRRDGVRVARVMACRRIGGMPVLAYLCGRERRLYLAMVYRDHDWQVVGVFGCSGTARRKCAKALGEVIA